STDVIQLFDVGQYNLMIEKCINSKVNVIDC
ncbi:MAG: hypothetical protein EZS28_040073, partial [Streblomastix strix]